MLDIKEMRCMTGSDRKVYEESRMKTIITDSNGKCLIPKGSYICNIDGMPTMGNVVDTTLETKGLEVWDGTDFENISCHLDSDGNCVKVGTTMDRKVSYFE